MATHLLRELQSLVKVTRLASNSCPTLSGSPLRSCLLEVAVSDAEVNEMSWETKEKMFVALFGMTIFTSSGSRI